ncbi:MAG: hypothetical protein FJ275_00545 [Planctomycetes bacterium]|nr:hypothetical protein [Planctomycetota bacterium]
MTLKTMSFRAFTRARHQLWLERAYGAKAPKEADALRPHHYTNLWRELDRGTVFLFNEVQRPRLHDRPELIRHTILYRIFNVRETYEDVCFRFGNHLHRGVTAENLYEFLSSRDKNFTNAYVRCCDLRLVCEQLANLDGHLYDIGSRLEYGQVDEARDAISRIYSFGAFTGDQLMMDLCWEGGPFAARFAPKFGPGAQRGLAYCMENGYGNVNHLLRTGHEEIPEASRPTVNGLPIAYDLRTLEHTLCELSKHVKFQTRGDRQVKMRSYRPSASPVDPLPFAWGAPEVRSTEAEARECSRPIHASA